MVAVVAASAALAACGSSSDSSTSATSAATTASGSTGTTAAAKSLTIGVVGSAAGNPAYVSFYCGAVDQAKEAGGVKTSYSAPTDYTAAKGVPVLQAVARTNPSGIAVAPLVAPAYVAPIKQIVSSGIPVVAWDSALTPNTATQEQTPDHHADGELAGKTLSDLMGHKGTVLILDFQPGVPVAQRAAGFVDYMKASEPNIKVLPISYAGADVAVGNQKTKAALLAHPEITGLYATNYIASQGAVAAINTAGKKGKIKVVAGNSTAQQAASVSDGGIDALVAESYYLMGRQSIDTLVKLGRNETQAADLQKIVYAPVKVVTKANVDDPDVKNAYIYHGCDALGL